MRKYAVAVLAAGCGRRLGRTKQSTIFDGENLLSRAVRIALESNVGEVFVVLGYEADHLKDLVSKDVSIQVNENWLEGIASSIRTAVEYATERGCDGILFTTCDQPFVDAELLRSLVDAFEQTSKSVVASFYGTPGIPAIFSKEKFSELLLLTGDKGAKRLIQSSAAHLVSAPLAQYDIDTESDLETCRVTYQKENVQWQTKKALAATTTPQSRRIFPEDVFSKEPA